MSKARLLVVDDDLDLLHLIDMRLSAAGYEVIQATSGESALELFRAHRPRLVITDLRMGAMDGLTLFGHLQAEAPTVPVIILTAHGSIADAVTAGQQGVFSFLTKPFDGQELLRRVRDALRLSPALDPAHASARWRRTLLTANVRMEDLLRQALHISEEDRCALIIGPNGSGKATLIHAMHQAGRRASAPLVTLSATDLPASELEGALLPAGEQSVFQQAIGGVLHIRDIGALSSLAQSRLFSVLLAQTRAADPLNRLESRSDNSPPAIDVQILASSSQPLDTAVAEGANQLESAPTRLARLEEQGLDFADHGSLLVRFSFLLYCDNVVICAFGQLTTKIIAALHIAGPLVYAGIGEAFAIRLGDIEFAVSGVFGETLFFGHGLDLFRVEAILGVIEVDIVVEAADVGVE